MAKIDYVTRTVFTLKGEAYAIKMDGNIPIVETVQSDEWVSTTKSDMPMAKRLLKKANSSISLDSVKCVVVKEEIHAMTLEDFLNQSIVVRRLPNGKVEPIEEQDTKE